MDNKILITKKECDVTKKNEGGVVVKRYFVQSNLWALGSLIFCLYYSVQFGKLFEICFDMVFGLAGVVLKNTAFVEIIEAVRWSPYCISGTIVSMLYLSVWHSEDIKTGNRKALILTTILAIGITLFKSGAIIGKVYFVVIMLHMFIELRKIGVGTAMAIFRWPICPKKATRPYSAFVIMLMFGVLIFIMAVCSGIEALGIKVFSIFAILFKMAILEQFSELYDRSYDAVFYHKI